MYLPDNDGSMDLDVFSFIDVLRLFCLQQEGVGILLLPVSIPAVAYKIVLGYQKNLKIDQVMLKLFFLSVCRRRNL